MLPLELLGAPEGSCLVRACLDVEQLTVHLAITAPTAACPVCGSDARRVRSRYTRRLDDLPCLGRRVRLRSGTAVGSGRHQHSRATTHEPSAGEMATGTQHFVVLRFLPMVPRCWTFWMYSGAYGILHAPTRCTATGPIFAPVWSARSVSACT